MYFLLAGGFPGLRWDDQQRIKDSISGKTTAAPLKSGNPDAESDSKVALDQFVVGYANSGRAKCRACGEKIAEVSSSDWDLG